MDKLVRQDYVGDTVEIARRLVGCLLVRRYRGETLVFRITETEAYVGAVDKACHAYGYRKTRRNATMFGPPGHAYLYLIYGMHTCLNFVTNGEGEPDAVLLRGLEIVEGRDTVCRLRHGKSWEELTAYQRKNLLNGPGKCCQALALDTSSDGLDLLGNDLYICRPGEGESPPPFRVLEGKRIGIDYAEEAVDFPWRFTLEYINLRRNSMLIFDMDGTLIDSNGIWRDVDIAFLKKRNMPYTKEYYEGVAHTIFPLAAVFTKEYCQLEESTDEIMAEWMEMAGDMYATAVTVKPGVRAYLERCRERGERMMVLTSSVPEHCRTALTHLGLMEFFERIVFAQELGLEKKNPECFRKAAAAVGVAPEECTMFDDSVAACRGAKAAGLQVVGVYDEFFDMTWDEMQQVCDRCIRSFEEMA